MSLGMDRFITFDIRYARPGRATKSKPMRIPTLLRVPANALVVAILLPFATACNEEEPTIGVVRVTDPQGLPVVGATVKLFADPTFPLGDPNRLDKEAVTDSDGAATFDYTDFYEQGQSGFAVLDIRATKDTLLGEGIIKIVEEETSEETVVMESAQ
jgi:hypothetical protein